MPPIRDVDWHSDKSDIVREPQRRAALGQRLGTAALSGQESLANGINWMIAVREDLREIRARVAYDIKKLSQFSGDCGSEETLEDDEPPNLFHNSDSEHDGDDTGSAHAGPKSDGSEVGSIDLDSDVDSDDVHDVDDVDD
ncbi:unnamed protein product [Penicillium crustosum]